MSLRSRIVLSLVLITAILVSPVGYGLWSLDTLQEIAAELRIRDARSSLRLGRLQTAVGEVQRAQNEYAVLRRVYPAEAADKQAEVDVAKRRVEGYFAELANAGYRDETAEARARWRDLARILEREEAVLATGDADLHEQFRNDSVFPALARMDASLDPIARAIDAQGAAQVERARNLTQDAFTGTAIALVLALGLALAVGSWMARSLLHPIQELRRGMAHVAEGDFEPDVQIPRTRPDELGDLARSFESMTVQLTELDRLKAEFVSVASHEIKTPLSVIRGYVSLLLDGIYGQVTDAQRKTLTSVSDQADRLTRLVHRLLDVSRFEAGGGRLELREIPVRAFLADLTQGFEVLAFQNEIDFRVHVTDDIPVQIVGDAERLNEVLGNLLSNAFKFTGKGGSIRVRASRADDGVAVQVEDSGVGIPADKLPHVFEKFYQVDNEAQPRSAGSGLGLAIAREIVEAHGGTITAESEVGRGTSFRVVLPAAPPASGAHS